jgi:hypothetical protein
MMMSESGSSEFLNGGSAGQLSCSPLSKPRSDLFQHEAIVSGHRGWSRGIGIRKRGLVRNVVAATGFAKPCGGKNELQGRSRPFAP